MRCGCARAQGVVQASGCTVCICCASSCLLLLCIPCFMHACMHACALCVSMHTIAAMMWLALPSQHLCDRTCGLRRLFILICILCGACMSFLASSGLAYHVHHFMHVCITCSLYQLFSKAGSAVKKDTIAPTMCASLRALRAGCTSYCSKQGRLWQMTWPRRRCVNVAVCSYGCGCGTLWERTAVAVLFVSAC